MTLRHDNDERTARRLHKLCFPGEWFEPGYEYWIARDERGRAVGYCSLRLIGCDTVFFNRACVIKRANGQGLQRRMIMARLRWCKQHGVKRAITYAKLSNVASWTNLVRCGMRVYDPQYRYGGKDALYFCKVFQ